MPLKKRRAQLQLLISIRTSTDNSLSSAHIMKNIEKNRVGICTERALPSVKVVTARKELRRVINTIMNTACPINTWTTTRVIIHRHVNVDFKVCHRYAVSRHGTTVLNVSSGGDAIFRIDIMKDMRVGGNMYDALKYIFSAESLKCRDRLSRNYSLGNSRIFLSGNKKLYVGFSYKNFFPKKFNNQASAGPTLKSVGIYKKEDLFY